jgi:hypothetical protein
VEGRRRNDAASADIVSSADGTFEFPAAAGAEYWFAPAEEGVRLRPTSHRSAVRAGERVEIEVTLGSTVEFALLLPDGTEPAEAEIRVSADGRGGDRKRWTPAGRRIALPAGTIVVRAVTPDEAFASEEERVAAVAGGGSPVTLRLAGRPGIRGRVILPAGLEVADLRVDLIAWPEGAAPEDPWWRFDSGRPAGTSGGCVYRFLDLAPGRYLLAVRASRRLLAREVVEVLEGLVERDLPVALPSRADTLMLVAERCDGKPVEELEVGFEIRGPLIHAAHPAETVLRQADGSYLVFFPEEDDGFKGARWFATVVSPKYGRREVEFERTEATTVRVRFEEPASLEITIDGAGAGAAAPRLSIRAGGLSATPDAEGRAVLSPLPPGPATVSVVAHPGGAPQGNSIVQQETVLVSGANRLAVKLPVLTDLTIVFEGAEASRGVFVHSLDDPQLTVSGRTTRDGRCVFLALPPGRYVVRSDEAAGGEQMEVTLPGPSTVRFAAGSPRTAEERPGGELKPAPR